MKFKILFNIDLIVVKKIFLRLFIRAELRGNFYDQQQELFINFAQDAYHWLQYIFHILMVQKTVRSLNKMQDIF